MPLSLCMWYKFTSGMVGALSETFSNLNAIYRMLTASQGYDYSTFKLHVRIAGPVRDKANMHSQLVQLNFNHKLHKHFHCICAKRPKTWIKDYLCRLYADMLSSRMQQWTAELGLGLPLVSVKLKEFMEEKTVKTDPHFSTTWAHMIIWHCRKKTATLMFVSILIN